MFKLIVLLVIAALIIIGLNTLGMADSYNLEACLPEDNVSGFFMGLWHGCIQFFSLIGSYFSEDIKVYDLNNNGFWYNFGFLLGTGLFYKTGSSTVSTQGEG